MRRGLKVYSGDYQNPDKTVSYGFAEDYTVNSSVKRSEAIA